MTTEIRHGRWQDVLAGVKCDHLIGDAPYSPRTHEGRRTGSEIRQSGIAYDPITIHDVVEFVRAWDGRVAEWWIIFGDDVSCRWWRRALKWAGKYVFQPVVWVKTDAPPRMDGGGPASSVEHIAVARESHWPTVRGSRPGHYIGPTASTRGTGNIMPGQKPLWLMQAIVRDYTAPGTLIVDPFAGSGTTLEASSIEGRNAIGAEQDATTYALAAARLARGHTPTFPSMVA